MALEFFRKHEIMNVLFYKDILPAEYSQEAGLMNKIAPSNSEQALKAK